MEVTDVMTPEEVDVLGVNDMTADQKQDLLAWGLRMFSLGQYAVGDIEDIKYDGKLIVLDDGSRWVVDSYDTDTADMWGSYEKVVVIDGEMYKLDESEKISVEQDYD